MKPPAFDYHRPTSLGEALDVLAGLGSDGKVLAGGQSLLPILSMRLAAPKHLVDINRIAELSYIRCDLDGVRVAALARVDGQAVPRHRPHGDRRRRHPEESGVLPGPARLSGRGRERELRSRAGTPERSP